MDQGATQSLGMVGGGPAKPKAGVMDWRVLAIPARPFDEAQDERPHARGEFTPLAHFQPALVGRDDGHQDRG